MENEKWIVLPESWYINSNPEVAFDLAARTFSLVLMVATHISLIIAVEKMLVKNQEALQDWYHCVNETDT